MRVAILSPYYPYRGGIAQFSEKLSSALEAGGHEVKVFGFKRLYPDILFPGKTQFVDASEQTDGLPSERVLDSICPFSYSATVKSVSGYAPDVLIMAYWMSFFVPAYAHIASRLRRKCRVLLLVHNAIPHEPRFFDKPLARMLFKLCHGFVAMSDKVADDIRRLCPGAQCVVSPHPLYDQFGKRIDRQSARQNLSLPDRKTLLFFGLIRDYKGLDLLIEAMNLLDDSYQLLIAGECYGSFDKYMGLIRSSSASERIFPHLRFIPDRDVPVFFSAADALVLPYRSATQSGVVSIAFFYGLPMVSTPVGDFFDSIARTGTGVVVADVSTGALADGICSLFSSNKLVRYSENLKAERQERTWERFVDRALSLV